MKDSSDPYDLKNIKTVRAIVDEWFVSEFWDLDADWRLEEQLKDYTMKFTLFGRVARTRELTTQETLRTETAPKTAWQHFKQERFPEWALKRWPVKQRKFPVIQQFNVYRTCPHIHRHRDCEKDLIFHVLEDPEPPDVAWKERE